MVPWCTAAWLSASEIWSGVGSKKMVKGGQLDEDQVWDCKLGTEKHFWNGKAFAGDSLERSRRGEVNRGKWFVQSRF